MFNERVGLDAFQEKSVRQFLAHLQLSGKSYATILSYVSALKFHCRASQIGHALDSVVVKSTLRGVRNLECGGRVDTRSGCSLSQLDKLCRMATVALDGYRGKLFKAMMALAFFGFLRVSEYACTEAGHSILRDGCRLDDDGLVVVVPSSKFSRRPVRVKVTARDGERVCPVLFFRTYSAVRPAGGRKELFLWSSGLPVSAAEFARQLAGLCAMASMERLTTHAFRIGGATWAARAGWPDSVIRAHGRWGSDAFLRYIRPV